MTSQTAISGECVCVCVCVSPQSTAVWSCPSLSSRKIQTTCFSNNEFKSRIGKAPYSPSLPSPFLPFSLPPPLLLLLPPSLPRIPPHISHHISPSIFLCLFFSSVRSHLSLRSFYPTAAWGQVELSVKWMMGNWVPAESIWCDLLTYCLSETRWEEVRKCTVGEECKWKKP